MAQPFGACGDDTKAPRQQLCGRVGRDPRVTIRRQSEGRINLEMCKNCSLYHCPFCKTSVYKPKADYGSVWTHIEIHRIRAVKHGEFSIYTCNLECREERHFHCPYCAKTITTKRQFEIHLGKCAQSSTRSSHCLAPLDRAHLPTAAIGKPALLMLNLTPVVQQVLSATQSSDLTNSTPDQNSAPTIELKSTADQHQNSTASPVQTKPSVNQQCFPNDPSVQMKAVVAKPPASSTSPIQLKPTVDQPPMATYCFVEPAGVSDQLAVSLAVPVQPVAPVVYSSSYPANTVQQAPQISGRAKQKIKCSICNLYLHKKNLSKHKLRKHLISDTDITAKDHLRSQCIDSRNGVYAVSKYYKTTAVPVHVIKKRSAGVVKMLCEEDRCEVIFQFKKNGGLPYTQCPHLRSVDFCISHARREDVDPSVLEELVTNNMIGKEMMAKCRKHRDQAAQHSAPLVALVDLGGNHCLYFSVFEPKATQYSKFGRLFVTYNIRGKFWQCDCSQGRIYCLHKCIAKWYLFQTNQKLFSSNAIQETVLDDAEAMESTPETLLPSGDENLEQMAKYVYHQKKLPSALPENLTQFESEIQFSKHLIPAETVCQECPGQVCLTEPVLITDKARVVTSTGVIQDNSTFLKKCPECDLMYHYQEWSEGLHNYNSHIILSLQLCVLLQNLIQNHGAEDGLAVVLKQTVGDMSSCGMEVLQAYLHFEALQSHECPSLFMIDLYQKGIFNMAGIEIHGMPEPLTGDVNAEEIWDSVCKEIITSGLNAHNSVYVETNNVIKEAAVSAVTTPFKLSEGKRLNKEKTEQCHKAVTRFLVKTLQPLSTVESPWFRDLTKTLNSKYRPPSIDELRKTLVPSWYSAEKKRAVKELLGVTEAALTCDWWSNSARDHYLTVNLHFIMKGQMMHKVLCTKPVYGGSTAEAQLMHPILEEFGVQGKVVAVTADDISSVDISSNSVHIRKLKCFACILNLAAQKVFTCSSVVRWVSKIQAVLAWIKTSPPAQNILQEQQKMFIMKQQVLLFQSSWDSLYLMVEQFVEQFAAIQATLTDPQVRDAIEEKSLEMLTENDYQEAEEFIQILKPLYTSSLCVSAEKSPTCSQIFPILKKLEAHFQTQHEDTPFTNMLKEAIWGDLTTHYKDGDTWNFLQEASALDPRFKNRIDSDEIWQRVLSAARDLPVTEELSSDAVSELNDAEHSEEAPFSKRLRLSALEELFEAEDRALKSCVDASSNVSIPTRLLQEIELYRKIPAIPTSEDPLVWWWDRRGMLPFLYQLSNSYLCIQASSTPRERAFSTEGDKLSQERSHVLPEHADLLIFLQQNC